MKLNYIVLKLNIFNIYVALITVSLVMKVEKIIFSEMPAKPKKSKLWHCFRHCPQPPRCMEYFCFVVDLYSGVKWSSLILSLFHALSLTYNLLVIFLQGTEYKSIWQPEDMSNIQELGRGNGQEKARSYLLVVRTVWSGLCVMCLPVVFCGLQEGWRVFLIPALVVSSLSVAVIISYLHHIYNVFKLDTE